MSSEAGLWIDHRQAFIVYILEDEIKTRRILSNLEKRVKPSGGKRSSTPYSPRYEPADDRLDRKYKHHLENYYEDIAQALEGVESVLIMGPGEGKGEFKKHLERHGSKSISDIELETTDKITENQIIAKVKQHFMFE